MEYLYHPRKPSRAAHVWTGTDTACRLWSTGGISASSKLVRSRTPDGRHVCDLCVNHFKTFDARVGLPI